MYFLWFLLGYSDRHRAHTAHKAKNVFFLTLVRKFADPWLKDLNHSFGFL